MIYGLYNSAAGMATNEYRQAVLANNLANADTVGFKRDIPVFAERAPARLAGDRSGPSAPDLAGLSGGLWLGRTCTDFGEASKVKTDNPLDVALDGPGFLSVAADGQRRLTRDGRMRLDTQGRLVAVSDGAPVLGRGGMPLQLNPFGGPPSIDQDGRIQQDGQILGELDLADVTNYAALQKVGEGRYATPDENLRPSPANVYSGYTESSGVKPVSELVSMIDASRAYQLNAQMISVQDQTLGRLITLISG